MEEVKNSVVYEESKRSSVQSDLEGNVKDRISSGRHEPALDPIKEDALVGYREYREGLDVEVEEEESRRIRWKVDLIVLPIFLVTQTLQYMDRSALNYANLFGYQTALNLKGNQFNYLSAMPYAGYFIGLYPAGWLIGRFPAQRVQGIACLTWAVFVILMTQARTFGAAVALRFLMGLFEAPVTPGLTLMTGFWYTRREIPLRQCIWYSSLGLGGIIGSYISMGLSKLPVDSKPERWQLIFYILGGATFLWSFAIYFVLADSPPNAWWLSKKDRIIAVKRVASNELGIKTKTFNKKQAIMSFYDIKMILVFIAVFAASVPAGVINSFSTIIIKDMGFSTTMTTELKSVGDAVQVVALIVGGSIILNVPNSRLAVASAANILCVTCAATLAYLPRSNKWGRLVSFWLVNSQSLGFTVSLTTISSNMGGYTHRQMANAFVFVGSCWGNFAGPFVVKPSQAPNYSGASIGLLVSYAVKTASHLALLAYLIYMNKHRDRVYGPQDKERSNEAGMLDETEFENKDFRFVL